jgi:hypothetical protein
MTALPFESEGFTFDKIRIGDGEVIDLTPKPSQFSFELEIPMTEMSPEFLQIMCGGTITSTGEWSPPAPTSWGSRIVALALLSVNIPAARIPPLQHGAF